MRRYSFFVDHNLCLLKWDDNLSRLRGIVSDSVVGRPYAEVFPPILSEGRDAVRRAVKDGVPVTCSGYRISCFFGEVLADLVIIPVVDERGTVIGAEVVIEADHPCSVSRTLDRLQPLVDIAKLSASLAHGVRNPLNAIKGAVTYLSDKYPDDTTLQEFTGIVHEEIDKLDAFVTRFLSHSVASTKTSVDLNELIRKMCLVTEMQAAGKGIRITCRFGRVGRVVGDEFQLEHAFMNLLTNAIEAMPGGGEISCSTAPSRLHGGAGVSVRIADDGPGFAQESACLDYPQEERAAVGRGFGLFLSREIIQSHGGRFEISSERGVGTSIVISLPVKEDDDS